MIYENNKDISNLTKDTYALILAGGEGSQLFEMTDWRAKSAVYFGGKFRLIDFSLSNCSNSGIPHIGVATQYKSHSLIRHLKRAWSNANHNSLGMVNILPASQRCGDNWYIGTADAVYQNLDIIRAERPKYILILSGDHVYRMDYSELLAEHVKNNADMTICSVEVATEEAAGSLGVLTINSDNKVIKFDEKPAEPNEMPGKPGHCLASMGNYVFTSEFLFEQLEKDCMNKSSSRDFGNDIIPAIIKDHNVFAFSCKDANSSYQSYWRNMATIDSYWEANMELLTPNPQLDLYDMSWPIWTHQEQLPPAKLIFNNDTHQGTAMNSTVSAGCIISGATICNSLLFPSVHVHSHTHIEESLLMPGCEIGERCKLRRVIVEKKCKIPANSTIGYNKQQDIANGFRVSEKGITLVTKDMLAAFAKKTA